MLWVATEFDLTQFLGFFLARNHYQKQHISFKLNKGFRLVYELSNLVEKTVFEIFLLRFMSKFSNKDFHKVPQKGQIHWPVN